MSLNFKILQTLCLFTTNGKVVDLNISKIRIKKIIYKRYEH